jgi:hypothetical protein
MAFSHGGILRNYDVRVEGETAKWWICDTFANDHFPAFAQMVIAGVVGP